jgi:hypothetical protein
MDIFELLHTNAIADRELLLSSDREGDVFDNPRDVDFAFRTKDNTKANDLCEFINGKNFGRAHLSQKEGDDLIWVIVIIHMPITQNVIGSISGFMVCLSRIFQVDFDGWGSVIQPDPGLATLDRP